MFVLVYLNKSYLHLQLSLSTLVLAVRKLQGRVDMEGIQSVESGEIPGSAHWGTS